MAASVLGLTKRYGSTLALDDVSLTIADGEIHALLGHNGAGKSTLIKCLGGGVSPTDGRIVIDGVEYASLTPRDAIAAGVAVIYQHLSVVDRLTVAENLFLGQEMTRGGLVRRGEQREQARAALERVGGGGIDPDTRVGVLPIGQRQLVEIAKAVHRNAKLLILDEPTAALSKAEAEQLGELVLELRRSGIAILYVTHLLGEVLKLADEVTVMKNGRSVWSADRPGITKQALIQAISDGHGASNDRPAPPRVGDEPALAVAKLTGAGLGPIDLTVRAGEIIACYGLIGSGRTRFLNTLFGRVRADGGSISVDGTPRLVDSPIAALRAGISLVPGDRAREGLFASLPALDNTVINAMRPLSKGGFRSQKAERGVFERVAGWLDLRPLVSDLPAGRFSGGNQQKILLGRWVNDAARTRVLLLDDPTQGVDVGARKDIYDAIKRMAADRGIGILVATNEADEVMDLAHRCLLFRGGAIVDDIDVGSTSADALLAAIQNTPARLGTDTPGISS
jgi:ribose transport system ATP-binding protein